MKSTLLSLLVVFGIFSVASVGAYYNDNCSSANNFCGGTSYRCDIYCTGNNQDYDYCNRNCGNWNNSNWDTNHYDGWNNNEYNNQNYFNYNYNTKYSQCYHDIHGIYNCIESNDPNNYYSRYNNPSWFPASSWFWSQDDLSLMTQSLNSDTVASQKRPDFFETNVLRKDSNWKKLNAITIKSYSLKSEDMQQKYGDSKKFLAAIKDAIWQRYSDGVIKNYQMADIIRDLGDTVNNLNANFSYTSQYEKTGNGFYNEVAIEKLDAVKTNYDRLKGSLKWRS